MDDEIPLNSLSDIPVTRLDDYSIKILDDIQSSMSPDELVNRVFMRESIEKNIPINDLMMRK